MKLHVSQYAQLRSNRNPYSLILDELYAVLKPDQYLALMQKIFSDTRMISSKSIHGGQQVFDLIVGKYTDTRTMSLSENKLFKIITMYVLQCCPDILDTYSIGEKIFIIGCLHSKKQSIALSEQQFVSNKLFSDIADRCVRDSRLSFTSHCDFLGRTS